MTVETTVYDKALLYQQELIRVRMLLSDTNVNWWLVYPLMVRTNEAAKKLAIKQPFNRRQMALGKDKLCNSQILTTDY